MARERKRDRSTKSELTARDRFCLGHVEIGERLPPNGGLERSGISPAHLPPEVRLMLNYLLGTHG